ncbi:hypothetical protein PR048_019571 [Dryococelus australis]|uniref:Uncharacterized protein n=1 Tax=Dryococelus australis TaxID=614101 RepID=A0ABQ9H3Y6_9NEOP|nr:hypothetical protein PR048_019571 [Dryococelus australis]
MSGAILLARVTGDQKGRPRNRCSKWEGTDCGNSYPRTVSEFPRSMAAVAERLARPPPTKANRVQSPTGSSDFCMWESC